MATDSRQPGLPKGAQSPHGDAALGQSPEEASVNPPHWVDPEPFEVYREPPLTPAQERFYLRSGNSSPELPLSQAQAYIDERFV